MTPSLTLSAVPTVPQKGSNRSKIHVARTTDRSRSRLAPEDRSLTPVMNGVMNGGTRSLKLVWDGPFTLVNARTGHWSNHAAENARLRQWAEQMRAHHKWL